MRVLPDSNLPPSGRGNPLWLPSCPTPAPPSPNSAISPLPQTPQSCYPRTNKTYNRIPQPNRRSHPTPKNPSGRPPHSFPPQQQTNPKLRTKTGSFPPPEKNEKRIIPTTTTTPLTPPKPSGRGDSRAARPPPTQTHPVGATVRSPHSCSREGGSPSPPSCQPAVGASSYLSPSNHTRHSGESRSPSFPLFPPLPSWERREEGWI